MTNILSLLQLIVARTCLLGFVFPFCYGQNRIEPEFKNELGIVKMMLSDSSTTFSNDTLTIEIWYYNNGIIKNKRVFYHPDGIPIEKSQYPYLNYAETAYNEDGRIAHYSEWYNEKQHGNQLMFDSDSFVTHWVFENGNLIDVKNDNCRYLDPKGKIISKNEFFKRFESEEYGQWGYYLFFPKFDPYNRLNCCDFIMYSDKYRVMGEGKAAKKLIKRLNKTCH